MKQMETERLILRQFVPTDWEDLYEYLSIPEVVQYEPYNIYSREDCIKEAKNRSEEQTNNRFWAVCLKNSKKMIGHVYFAQEEPEEFKTWEIGYVFNPNFYGHGYATEACIRILQYGLKIKKPTELLQELMLKIKHPGDF